MTQEQIAGADDMQYCPHCAAPLIVKQIPSEDRPRLICDRGHVIYVNPKLVVGVIPERDGRVLLMRRAIEPRYGAWTFPGGFMEIDETVEQCAAREAYEEVGIHVEILDLVGVYSRPGPHGPSIVSIVFRGATGSDSPKPGREALEAKWVLPEEIPWDDLAYDTTRWALTAWVEQQHKHDG
ncbi:MAG: NUDIX domain-containing protein [Dehalococcoidia bacterium]